VSETTSLSDSVASERQRLRRQRRAGDDAVVQPAAPLRIRFRCARVPMLLDDVAARAFHPFTQRGENFVR
jgi:hypothetical protein